MQTSSKKSLGFWTLAALVSGNMLGSGVFLLPTTLGHYGSIGILAWAATAVGAMLLALVFAKLGGLLPREGGPYAYCREGFGDFVGFMVAYNYWIFAWVGNAAIVVALVSYLSVFWPEIAHNHWLSFGISVSCVWLLTFVNILGVKEAGIVQLVTTVLKLLPLFLMALVAIFYIEPTNLKNFNVSGQTNWHAFVAVATITLWSFIGLESATIPVDNVDNPEKVIPKATMAGVIATAIVYLLSITAVMGILPMAELAKSNAPFADVAGQMFGHWGALVLGAVAVIACFGTLNGWILLQGQVPYAAANDNLFPKNFGKLNKNGSPAFGLIVSSVLITILLTLTLKQDLVKQFEFIIELATLTVLVPYIFTTMSELILFRKYRDKFNGKRFIGSSIIAVLAFMYSIWAFFGAGHQLVFYAVLISFSSIPFYVWLRKQRRL